MCIISHSTDHHLNKSIHIKLNLDINCIEWMNLKKNITHTIFFTLKLTSGNKITFVRCIYCIKRLSR